MDQSYSGIARLNVTEAIGRAWEHTKRLLFQPWNIGVWFSIGLMAFLELLVEGGGGGAGFNQLANRFPGKTGAAGGDSLADIAQGLREAAQWAQSNVGLVLAIALALGVFLLALTVLFTWLGSRGQMMLIRAISLSDTRLGDNWRTTATPAGSVFRFRLVFYAISFVVNLACLFGLGYLGVRLLLREERDPMEYVVTLVPIFVIWMGLGIVLGLTAFLLKHFVVPLMYHFELPCMEAWKKAGQVLRGNIGPLVLFMLIRLVFAFIVGIVTMLVTLLTCCIGALPVIHQTLMAPFEVWSWSYTLYVLESLGPDFQIIRPAALPPTTGFPQDPTPLQY